MILNCINYCESLTHYSPSKYGCRGITVHGVVSTILVLFGSYYFIIHIHQGTVVGDIRFSLNLT